LSIEFLAVMGVALVSVAAVSRVSLPKPEPENYQRTAMLVDDLVSFGAPFSSDEKLAGAGCANHSMGKARTLTEELIMKGGYRYRTHCIIRPVIP